MASPANSQTKSMSLFGRLLAVGVCSLLTGCATTPIPIEVGPTPRPAPSTSVDLSPDLEACEQRLEAQALELLRVNDDIRQLRIQLNETTARYDEKALALAAAEESLVSLEAEWRNAIEVVLRPEAQQRRIDNRPLAVSRIAELRVEFQGLEQSEDQGVLERVGRAQQLLASADEALRSDNPSGAGFFAERAGDLLRQARTVVDFQSVVDNRGYLPLLPPRQLRVTVSKANLRDGPGLDHRRVTSAAEGEELVADARSGDWFRVDTLEDGKAWIYGALVEQVF